MSKETKVKLMSSDDEILEVEEMVAFQSQTIKDMVEDAGTESVILLANISSKTLSKVIDYCRYQALIKLTPKAGSDDKSDLSIDEVKAWDSDLVNVDQDTLFQLITAAHDLKIKSLLDTTSSILQDRIKNKTQEEIRKIFNIPEYFTPAEEEEIRRKNPWAFE